MRKSWSNVQNPTLVIYSSKYNSYFSQLKTKNKAALYNISVKKFINTKFTTVCTEQTTLID